MVIGVRFLIFPFLQEFLHKGIVLRYCREGNEIRRRGAMQPILACEANFIGLVFAGAMNQEHIKKQHISS